MVLPESVDIEFIVNDLFWLIDCHMGIIICLVSYIKGILGGILSLNECLIVQSFTPWRIALY